MLRLDASTAARLGTAIVAGGFVLLLGISSTRSEFALSVLRDRNSVQHELADSALRLSEDLADKSAQLKEMSGRIEADPPGLRQAAMDLTSENYFGWWMEGDTLELAADTPVHIDAKLLLSQLEGSSAAVAGPFTSAAGVDVMVLQTDIADGPRASGARVGVVTSIDDLWAVTGLLDLIRSGLNVGVVDSAERPIYWTSPVVLEDPVSSELNVPGQRWRVVASPRDGWADVRTTSSNAVVALILAIAYAVWYMLLAKKPVALERERAELQSRLDDKNVELSALLRSRTQLETQLQTSLTVDLHTGLPNRHSLLEHVQAMLAQCRLESGSGVAIAVVQFSKLETLSQSMGPTVAENMIAAAADRLQREVEDAYVARVSQKELAVCIGADRIPDAAEFADRLSSSVEERFEVGRRSVFSPVTVGIATSEDGYEHAPELVGHASLAATAAAEDGRRWSQFRPETREERLSLLQLEADLQGAIGGNELRLHFQPIVNVAEGNIVGLESLLRWRHPTESWIGPDRFIPLAESIGQMAKISEWVLRQAVAHSKQWLYLRDVPIYITVNLTPRDLNRELCNLLFELLDSFDVPSECIRVEITETAVVRDFRVAARLISELDDRGIRVLLDDFGTGYSSLSYLRDLQFHAVKIDKSFVQRMTTEARDFGLVKSIVGLVHYLGMECVAEGIETQEQLDLIAMTDCDYGQGFYFSRPVPPSEIELLLSNSEEADQVTAS